MQSMSFPVPPPLSDILPHPFVPPPRVKKGWRRHVPDAPAAFPPPSFTSTSSDSPPTASSPPPPSLSALEEQKQEKPDSWTVDIVEDKIDLSSAVPCSYESFKDPNFWEKVTEVCKSDDGAVGVLFLNSPEGMLVVKAHSTMVQELYATKIGKLLNVPIPQVRVVGYRDSTEWRRIKEAIRRVGKSDAIKIFLDRQLKRAMTSIMEFVPGVSFGSMTRPFTPLQLEQLGGLVIFDILMNNSDRFPCGVWSELNEGNAGNCIVGKDCLRGIDQNIVSLNVVKSAEKVELHIQKVCKVVESIIEGDFESICFTQLLDFLKFSVSARQTFTKIELNSLRKGMLEVLKGICDVISLALFEEVKIEVQKSIRTDWENVWKDMLKLVKPEFHWKLVEECFKPYADRIETELNKLDF